MNVFISDAHADYRLAERATRVLQHAGRRVWLDTENVLVGDNWAAAKANALQNADAMLVLLTPQSVQSEWVRSEVSYALGQKSFKGRVVPVYERGVELADVPWVLHDFQGVDLASFEHEDDAFERVAEQLKSAGAPEVQ